MILPLILGVGEILWDLLPSGKQLGGAPANFAYHAHALGAEAWPLSRVGDDALGREILTRLGELDLPTEGVAVDAEAPTGTVSVQFLDGQPSYTIHENVAWDHLDLDDQALALATRADALCFGTLAQRSPQSSGTIRTLLAATPVRALRIFDINLRQAFYSEELIQDSLEAATVLKLSDTELPVLADLFALRGEHREQLDTLAKLFHLDAVALTRGARGSLLLQGKRACEHPGFPVAVVDTVGAGDAFTAALVMGLLAQQELEVINESANRLAAYVCSQAGATPRIPEERLLGLRFAQIKMD